jgi:hypothetical protein
VVQQRRRDDRARSDPLPDFSLRQNRDSSIALRTSGGDERELAQAVAAIRKIFGESQTIDAAVDSIACRRRQTHPLRERPARSDARLSDRSEFFTCLFDSAREYFPPHRRYAGDDRR